MSIEEQVEQVYDVSGVCFMDGKTNFNLENVYAACRAGRIRSRTSDVHITLDLAVYDHLDAQDLIDHLPGGTMMYRTFTVSISNADTGGRFSDSLISDATGRRVVLRTREF